MKQNMKTRIGRRLAREEVVKILTTAKLLGVEQKFAENKIKHCRIYTDWTILPATRERDYFFLRNHVHTCEYCMAKFLENYR
jgi:uncharacterized protein (DUF1800 family)